MAMVRLVDWVAPLQRSFSASLSFFCCWFFLSFSSLASSLFSGFFLRFLFFVCLVFVVFCFSPLWFLRSLSLLSGFPPFLSLLGSVFFFFLCWPFASFYRAKIQNPIIIFLGMVILYEDNYCLGMVQFW